MTSIDRDDLFRKADHMWNALGFKPVPLWVKPGTEEKDDVGKCPVSEKKAPGDWTREPHNINSRHWKAATNLGLQCGEVAGQGPNRAVLVFDADTPEADRFMREEMPPTYVVPSRPGIPGLEHKRHYFYLWDGDVSWPEDVPKPDGLDIRQTGGQVRVSPALDVVKLAELMHPGTGKNRTGAALPLMGQKQLASALGVKVARKKKAPSIKAPPRIKEESAQAPKKRLQLNLPDEDEEFSEILRRCGTPNERHNAQVSLGGKASARGRTLEWALETAEEIAKNTGGDWGREQVKRVRWGFEQDEREAEEEAERAEEEAASFDWSVSSSLVPLEVTKPSFLCGEWVMEGGFTSLHSRAGLGKTVLMTDIVRQLYLPGKGRAVAGCFTVPDGVYGRRTLWINGELPPFLMETTVRGKIAHEAVDMKSVDYTNLLDHAEGLQRIASGYGLLVLDTRSSLFQFDVMSVEAWNAFNKVLRPITEGGTAVLMATHAAKPVEGASSSSFGSSAQEWFADAVVGLERPMKTAFDKEERWEAARDAGLERGQVVQIINDKAKYGAQFASKAAIVEMGSEGFLKMVGQ